MLWRLRYPKPRHAAPWWGVLWLAHDQACEAELAATLTGILDGQGLPDLKDLQQHFQRPGNEPADVAVDIPPSETYDALLGHKEMAA